MIKMNLLSTYGILLTLTFAKCVMAAPINEARYDQNEITATVGV